MSDSVRYGVEGGDSGFVFVASLDKPESAVKCDVCRGDDWFGTLRFTDLAAWEEFKYELALESFLPEEAVP